MINTKQIIEIKKPDLKININKILESRFSPRVFLDKRVDDKDIISIFEAARWSPSCFNAQPWFFYYAVKGTPGFDKISGALMEGNDWAKKAPLLILGCYIGATSHGPNSYAMYDLGQAVFNIVVQSQSLGYYVHQMAGFSKDKIKKDLKIAPPIVPHVLIAVGKIGDYGKTDEETVRKDFQKRERKDTVCEKI